MIYPQLTGEPNFVLIGVAAVFGLLLVIITFYIISVQPKGTRSSRKHKTINNNSNSNFNSNSNSNSNSKGKKESAPTVASITIPITTQPPVPEVTLSNPSLKQVFNIKENIYTLDDAAGVCGALGADVASINQLIDAHKIGADWCNVGWTSDGLAAYPIQYSTWKTLQDNEPNKRNICGDVGINLARNDPNLLYGVNCFGIKPEPKGNEKVRDKIISDKQSALNAKIAQFRKNMNAIGVGPFNGDAWSA
jgi:hypothetical protein